MWRRIDDYLSLLLLLFFCVIVIVNVILCSDMWAVGCIFYEMLASGPLFPGEEVKGNKSFQENQLKTIFNGNIQ